MKKIFTLLFFTAVLSTGFAQYGQRDKQDGVYVSNDNRGHDKCETDYDRDDRKYDKHGKGYGKGAFIFTPREKDMAINQIYREYDYRIQSVRSNYGMGWNQKKRIIYDLENQRNEEIELVWHKFNSKKNKFGDHGRRNNDRRW